MRRHLIRNKNMLSTRFEKREDIQEGEKTWSQQNEKTSTKVKKTWFKENEKTFQNEIILPIRRRLLVGTKNMLSTRFEKREDIQKGEKTWFKQNEKTSRKVKKLVLIQMIRHPGGEKTCTWSNEKTFRIDKTSMRKKSKKKKKKKNKKSCSIKLGLKASQKVKK